MALTRSPEFCLKLTYRYLKKADHVPGDPGAGPFWSQGHNLNKLGRLGPIGDAINHYNIKARSLKVSDKKIFRCFILYKTM